MSRRQLLWLRNDLRSLDNRALDAALKGGPSLALFVVTPDQWQAHDESAAKVDLRLRALAELQQALARLNVPLLIRQCAQWRELPALLEDVCREWQIADVQVNEEYGVDEQRRDQDCATRLRQAGVGWNSHLDATLLPAGSVLTREGGFFKVFGQFRRACLERLAQAPPSPLPAPQAQAPLNIASDPLPKQCEGYALPAQSVREHWPAGEQEALARLRRFADERILDYQAQRDLPAVPGTSELSPYLALGMLSARQCLQAAVRENHGELAGHLEGPSTWIDELLWREFYRHILVGYPQVCRHQPFRPQTLALPWRDAPEDLQAWQQGRTGFPLIDAAMRQLHSTGWMHNRLRMLVAMFLSKHLLIDWRLGERYFMQQLIDGDLAANNGGWQWSASTGTDSVPYFRLFNPITQSRRFDPQGRFIRHWLPELAHLDDRAIHMPPRDLFGSAAYPAPIVDLDEARHRALAAFRDLPPV